MSGDDVLGAVLEQTGLHGLVYCTTKARAPWGLRMAHQPKAMFHVVLSGACWLTEAREQIQLVAGDVLVFPRGAHHALSDSPKSPKIDLDAWLEKRHSDGSLFTLGGKEGAPTEVLCGVYEFSSATGRHPVLDLLPDRIHLRASADLTGTLGSLRAESDRGARSSKLVVSRLLDVLFVQIVRAWVETAPAGSTGWIGALDDQLLSRAIAAIHDAPLKNWTVDELARQSGTSRATLARRFIERVGESPIAYATRVRLEEAAKRLVSTQDGLAAIASELGYATEFAFSRAFRRELGEPPGQFRDRQRRALSGSAPLAAPTEE